MGRSCEQIYNVGTKLEGWPGQKVFYCLTGSWIVDIVSVSENMPGYIDMCDVLSYRSDHLVRPFLGKKWENILKQHEQKGIRIHSKSSAYRRDSCSNDFDLIPKQQKICEVLIMNFVG